MNHEKELKEIVKGLKGNIMALGLDSKLVLEEIEKNKQIENYLLLDCIEVMPIDGKKRRNKKIPLKKLRKKVGKKRIDTVICRLSSIDKYFKYFIRDSIYMTKHEIIYYGKTDELTIDKEEFIKRYQRYKNVDVKFHNTKDGMMIYVKVNGAKNHMILDLFYFVRDSFYNAVQLFGDYLVQ